MAKLGSLTQTAKRQASEVLIAVLKDIEARQAEILTELAFLHSEAGKIEPALHLLGIYPTREETRAKAVPLTDLTKP